MSVVFLPESDPPRWTDRAGLTLVDLLVATCVALATIAAVGMALPPVLDVARAVPEATDLQQRARATEVVLAGLIGSAGAGADLLGHGPLPQAVPAVWPRRVLGGADPPDTAWADRLSLWQVEARAAQDSATPRDPWVVGDDAERILGDAELLSDRDRVRHHRPHLQQL
ncbi:hypothetical protein, partial [Luteitalea sp.]